MQNKKNKNIENAIAAVSLAIQVRNGEITWEDAQQILAKTGEDISATTLRMRCPYIYRLLDAGMLTPWKTGAEKASEEEKKFLTELVLAGLDVRDGNSTWDDVLDMLDQYGELINRDVLRRRFPYIWQLYDAGMIDMGEAEKEDEEAVVENAVKAAAEEPKFLNPDLLDSLSLKEKDFEVKDTRVYLRRSGVTEDGTRYFVSETARGRRPLEYNVEDIKNFYDEALQGAAKKRPTPTFCNEYNEDGKTVMEIDLADIHFGLLSTKRETGSEYNCQIAREYVLDVIRQFVEDVKDRHIDQLVLVTMGDVLHVDNAKLTTTKGTPQDVDGRLSDIIDIARDTMVDVVDMLLELGAPIQYVYVPGNHDEVMGYMLARNLEVWYREDDRIVFDTEPTLHKCLQYGKTSVVVTHGEENARRLSNNILTMFRGTYGDTKASEVHAGHLHSEMSQIQGSVVVRRVPAVCGQSYWEKSMGFPAIGRGIHVFEYNTKVAGLKALHAYYTGATLEPSHKPSVVIE